MLNARWHREPAPDPMVVQEPELAQPQGIAVLATAVDAKWGEGPALASGTVLEPRTMAIEAGVLEVEFYSGARLVIQGPATVELRSEMEVFCRRGRLVAYVPPPAHGFRAVTPDLTVVDLGTEFALSVPQAGATEVHVFRGAVELPRPDRKQPLKLVAGEAARVENTVLKTIPADSKGFLGERELSQLASGDVDRREAAWLAAAAALNHDPAVLAHFIFPRNDGACRTVDNRVARGAIDTTSASIVGCGWADGRWPAGRAVELKSPGDRIRLDVPGLLHEVTLLAWVRIDALPNDYHALLAPDGLAAGTLRWGITKRGQLRLSIARSSGRVEPNWEVVMSPPVVTPDRFGQWIMLVATFDGKVVRHFVDGAEVKSGRVTAPHHS